MTTFSEFNFQMSANGFCFFPSVVPKDLLTLLRVDIPRREQDCMEIRKANGSFEKMEGAAHHVVGGSDSLNSFLSAPFLDEYIFEYFKGPYILNSYGALNNMPYSQETYSHAQNFHRDVRTYSGAFRLMLNMLVMVDGFTVENGATKLVPGSHRRRSRPSDSQLEANCVRAVGPAGSIVLFNSNVWHSAAPNKTAGSRMALTLTFSRPFVKQQMDYPRFLGDDFPKTERMKQILGYNSRTPSNHTEWFQPPEKRLYKPGQG